MAALPAHFEFWLDILQVVNDNGHDIAVFFPRYILTPYGTYPTQLRQATGALRYILNETGRSPSSVIVGGDSAGGNLAMATLLHLSRPHPEIEPITLSEPLAGVFGFAPWINFSRDWPSIKESAWKDILTPGVLKTWSTAYVRGVEGDAWNEPDRAPVEWWKDVKTERILILAGSDEILLSSIEQFAKKIKVCWMLVLRMRCVDCVLIFRCSLVSRILPTSLDMMSLMMRPFMSLLGRRRRRKRVGNSVSGSLLVCRL